MSIAFLFAVNGDENSRHLYSRSSPFNSHEWPRQNFSLQYQYNIKQASDENKEKYQSGDYELIP